MNRFALCFFVVLCAASAAMGQRCPGSDFFPDQRGCCPVVVNSVPFYADAQGCFPRIISGVAFYADAGGCYPSSAGVYRSAGAVCPADRVCEPECPDMAIVVAEQQGGARLCANGFFSDVNGCCPRVLVDNVPSYRDAQVRRTTLALVVAWLHSAMVHIVTTATIHH